MEELTYAELTTVTDHTDFFFEIDDFDDYGSEIEIEENFENEDEIDLYSFPETS